MSGYLIDFLLQVKSSLAGVEGTLPVLSRGLGDVLEDNPATSHVLVLHQVPGMLVLLLRHLLEEVGEAMEGDIIAVEVGRLKSET